MIYGVRNSSLPNYIDRYVTGNYGEDNEASSLRCFSCGAVIEPGNSYYLLDNTVYCMDCEDEAHRQILNEIADNYIYVL